MTVDGAGRSKPQVRTRVLHAALAAVEEVGPDRVRVKDIADRAGMSSGHVLYYFGDRDRILLDTLLLSEADHADARARLVARTSDPAEAVDKLCRLYLPTGARDVRWALWAQMLARPPEDAPTRRALRDVADAWAATLAGLLGTLVSDEPGPAVVAYRQCRLMDGLALEVLLGGPGRARSWAVAEATASWRAMAATGR